LYPTRCTKIESNRAASTIKWSACCLTMHRV